MEVDGWLVYKFACKSPDMGYKCSYLTYLYPGGYFSKLGSLLGGPFYKVAVLGTEKGNPNLENYPCALLKLGVARSKWFIFLVFCLA